MGKDRFEKVYAQGTLNVTEIWVDKETGCELCVSLRRQCRGINPSARPGGKNRDISNRQSLT